MMNIPYHQNQHNSGLTISSQQQLQQQQLQQQQLQQQQYHQPTKAASNPFDLF